MIIVRTAQLIEGLSAKLQTARVAVKDRQRLPCAQER